MARKTIAEHMRDVLIENGMHTVSWGDVSTLDACAERCTHRNMIRGVHPLRRHQCILNALERSPLFEKGYIRLDVFQNDRSRLVRYFKLARSHQLVTEVAHPDLISDVELIAQTNEVLRILDNIDPALDRIDDGLNFIVRLSREARLKDQQKHTPSA